MARHDVDEDLTDAQLEQLEAKLRQLEAELRKTLAAGKAGTRPVDLDEPIGRISRIDAIQQQSMAAAQRQRQNLRLAQTEAALRRVAEDEYGLCLKCDEPIGFKRLSARPESPFCLSCQAKAEAR